MEKKARKQRKRIDPEILLMRKIDKLLAQLPDVPAKARVTKFFASRYW